MYVSTPALTKDADIALCECVHQVRLRVVQGRDVMVLIFDSVESLDHFLFHAQACLEDHIRAQGKQREGPWGKAKIRQDLSPYHALNLAERRRKAKRKGGGGS